MLTDPSPQEFTIAPTDASPDASSRADALFVSLQPPRPLDARSATRASAAGLVAVCRGTPHFLDAAIADLARTRGNAAAWLALYREQGERAPERTHGAFAVVVADETAHRVFAAVDRFAIESLCYTERDGGVAIADRADAFAQRGELDPQAIFDYLWFHAIPSPRTIFRGVQRLQPGHALTFERGTAYVWRYWKPAFDETRAAALPALCEEFRSLLRSAVARAAGTSHVGCYLSGGTDSSTVVGTVRDVTGRPPNAYSIGFDVAGYDEMAYARIAAAHFRADHREYYVTPQDVVENMARIAAQFDQPFGNSSALPAYCCARLAHADGMTRMLAGDGGDELFGGNTRYAKQRAFDLYGRIPAFVRHGVMEPLLSRRFADRVPLVRKAASYVDQARAPMPDRLEMYNLLVRTGVDAMFDPQFVSTVDVHAPLEQQRRHYTSTDARTLINRMLAYDWKYTLAENDLPKVVGSARLAGIDVAFPMLDERLVEFSLTLAPRLKLKGFELRWFFKHALRDFLPPEILAKKKHGFGMPFGDWAIRNERLRELVFDSLGALRSRGIVRAEFLDDVIERRLAEHPGYYGELVWILVMLELWLSRA